MAGKTSRNIFVCRNVSIERNRDGNKKNGRKKKIIHSEIGTNIIDSTRIDTNRVESLRITRNRAEITRSKLIETNRNKSKQQKNRFVFLSDTVHHNYPWAEIWFRGECDLATQGIGTGVNHWLCSLRRVLGFHWKWNDYPDISWFLKRISHDPSYLNGASWCVKLWRTSITALVAVHVRWVRAGSIMIHSSTHIRVLGFHWGSITKEASGSLYL